MFLAVSEVETAARSFKPRDYSRRKYLPALLRKKKLRTFPLKPLTLIASRHDITSNSWGRVRLFE